MTKDSNNPAPEGASIGESAESTTRGPLPRDPMQPKTSRNRRIGLKGSFRAKSGHLVAGPCLADEPRIAKRPNIPVS